MYPEDQTPRQNSLGEPPKPVTFGQHEQQPPRKPFNAKLLVWIAGGFLGLLLLAVGIVWASSLGKQNTAQNTPASSSTSQQDEEKDTDPAVSDECTAKQRRYQSKDLSLGFCYPKEWGNVTVSDATFDLSDDGARLKLNFADKPQVHIGLVSDDWSTDAGRDGVCTDPAQQELPDFASFSARWTTEGSGEAISSTRGLEIATDEYIIEEHVDNLLGNGVCLTGFKLTEGEVYRHAEASYYAPFTPQIPTPQAHINDPTKLVPVADRTAFIELVKSLHKE